MDTDNNYKTKELAEALFIVNRHAKTAPSPKYLYDLKKHTIEKLLKQKRAEKIGLHFSDHPKLSHQHSTLLVQVDDYYFHIPPTKQDFQNLKHLGNVDRSYRNPKPRLSLPHAKRILTRYLNWKLNDKNNNSSITNQRSSYFTTSSLGQISWPKQSRRNKRY